MRCFNCCFLELFTFYFALHICFLSCFLILSFIGDATCCAAVDVAADVGSAALPPIFCFVPASFAIRISRCALCFSPVRFVVQSKGQKSKQNSQVKVEKINRNPIWPE